MPMGLDYTN